MALSALLGFAVVAFTLIVVPGPDWAYVLAAGTRDHVVVPVVVTVDALDVLELVLAVLLVLELTDVTVLPDPSRGEPGRHQAGPEVVEASA